MDFIKIDNLRLSHGNTLVVNDLTLKIAKGEFIVIVGPSGSGKSTLLDAIAGLHPVDTGTITLANKDVSSLDPSKRNIAMVFQDYALYPNMNVEKNIEFALKIQKMDKQKRQERIKRALTIVKMEKYQQKSVNELSGGEKQRIAIARAIATSPQVFLMDEPLSNLDAKLKVELRHEIKRIHQELQTTTIMVTHDQVDALSMADRIIVLNDGKIMQIATPEQVYHQPESLFVARFFNPEYLNELTAEQYYDLTKIKISAEIVCFKPTDVKVVEQGISGIIVEKILYGDNQIIRVKCTNYVVAVSVENDFLAVVGNNIEISIRKISEFSNERS